MSPALAPKPDAICLRCSEPLRDAAKPCGFCIGELTENAIKQLARATDSTDAALAERADAIDALRGLGYSQKAVVHARAQVLDHQSVEEIVAGLRGEEPKSCPECNAAPAVNGDRCFDCRGRSMQ